MVDRKSFSETLSENLAFVISGAIGAFLIATACIAVLCIGIYCCYKRRNRRTRRYSRLRTQPVISPRSTTNNRQQNGGAVPATGVARGGEGEGRRQEEGLYEAMQRQRQEQEASRRETGLLNCQYYLRSNQKFVMETHLPDIGSRISKNWFIVRPIRETQYSVPYLLTMLPISQQCRLNLQSSDKHIFNKILKVIEHPCVHKVTSVDYIPDKKLVVILEPFLQRGSLKDQIYQTTPSLSWATKYSVRRTGLRVHQIQNYGRQILEAIMFLNELGIEPLGQIQTGNVYIDGGRCKLSGIDNSLLGYKPRIFRLIKHYRENIDTAMFGHLLFELASGRELSSSIPTETDYTTIKVQPVIDVLRFIFTKPTLPSIPEILELDFFQGARVSALEHWSHEGVRLDEDMTSLIYKSRKGQTRPQTIRRKRGRSGGAEMSSYSEGIHPSSPSNTTVLMSTSAPRPIMDNNMAQTPKTTSTAVPKTSTPIPSTSSRDDRPPPSSKDRTALLTDIHKGKKLKQTVTNDRSAPILK